MAMERFALSVGYTIRRRLYLTKTNVIWQEAQSLICIRQVTAQDWRFGCTDPRLTLTYVLTYYAQ